jgi:DNA-binding transcriptional LysR family regulator
MGPLRLQDLEPYTLLLREPGSGTRLACEEYFKEKRVHFTQTQEVASAEAQRECVLAGLGLALLTRHALNLELATGALIELPVEELPLLRSWCLVQAKAKRLSPVAHAFLAFIRSERAQISALVERFDGKLPVLPASS